VSFDPPLYLDLLIAWKRHLYLSRANQAFVDFLLQQSSKYI
jgi:DNA-binding transcriptional LysR family regulator